MGGGTGGATLGGVKVWERLIYGGVSGGHQWSRLGGGNIWGGSIGGVWMGGADVGLVGAILGFLGGSRGG